MTQQELEDILKTYREASKNISELYSMGFDFMEGKYKLLEPLEKLVWKLFRDQFTEEGVAWIDWFIFESEYGEKDWSKSGPLYKTNEKGELEKLVKPSRIYGAHDQDGNPICYDYASLYLELITNHRK